MKYIDEILEELRVYAEEFAAGENSKEEFNLKVDLLIRKVERIEINFEATRLGLQSSVFNQLLLQRRFKAIEALKELQQTENKRVFNAKIRKFLSNKLYFLSFYHTLKRNVDLYQVRDGKPPVDPQIFIKKEIEEHE